MRYHCGMSSLGMGLNCLVVFPPLSDFDFDYGYLTIAIAQRIIHKKMVAGIAQLVERRIRNA